MSEIWYPPQWWFMCQLMWCVSSITKVLSRASLSTGTLSFRSTGRNSQPFKKQERWWWTLSTARTSQAMTLVSMDTGNVSVCECKYSWVVSNEPVLVCVSASTAQSVVSNGPVLVCVSASTAQSVVSNEPVLVCKPSQVWCVVWVQIFENHYQPTIIGVWMLPEGCL